MTRVGGLAGVAWLRLLREAGTDPELAARLAEYLAILSRFAGAMDLIGRLSPEALVKEHVLGALHALPYLPEDGALLDVGSGAGLPAVPLLLARPGLRGVLLEPRERRWAFLREVVREVGVNAAVERVRVADLGGFGFDALTCRGVSAREWAGEAKRVVVGGGVVIWWTAGRAAAAACVPGGFVPVLPSAAGDGAHGAMRVWRRCST